MIRMTRNWINILNKWLMHYWVDGGVPVNEYPPCCKCAPTCLGYWGRSSNTFFVAFETSIHFFKCQPNAKDHIPPYFCIFHWCFTNPFHVIILYKCPIANNRAQNIPIDDEKTKRKYFWLTRRITKSYKRDIQETY